MKKQKRLIQSKKFYIILTTSLLAITVLTLTIGGIFVNKKPSNFMAYTDYYESEQYPIGSVSEASDTNVVSMTNAATGTDISGKTITISSKEELYLFSTILNDNESFRGYNYKLTGNVDYEGQTSFEPIVTFSGTFDGMGYEISNLVITDHINGYVSMFAENTGNISNFGLVEPNIETPSSETDLYVAPICGVNSGEISYVFVRDLRNPQEEVDAGMLTNGYHLVSGLVYENRNLLHDSYTAYEILVNREAVDSVNQFSELLAVNNGGSISNLYFYHGSIESYEIKNGKYEIKYDSGTINKEYSLDAHFGTYSNSIETLNTNVTGNDSQDKWHVAGDYGTFATYLAGIITPISRGMEIDENDTNTFIVEDEADYSYMYELMNMNPFFASSVITYKIKSNINLGLIPSANYQYNRVIDATITGAEGTYDSTSLTGSGYSNYPTITNASISKILTEGIDCYGVFSYVSGTISNLNIVNASINYLPSSNIQAVGLAVGYLDGGVIDNVNTFGTISFGSNIGKFYVGHLVGLSAGNASISNVTAAGTINNTNAAAAGDDVNDYMNGSAIGGIVGYSTSTLSSLDTCLSVVNITSGTYSSNSKDIAIGGILGAGYTDISVYLENRGTITVTGNSSNLYVAGIIGRHLGLKTQSSFFNNAGNITVTLSGQTTAMVSGVVNADIQVEASEDLATSTLRENGRYQYQAASFTNGADIILTNSSATNLEYTNVLNINSKNGFESRISGIYNLQYRTSGAKDNLNAQEIKMNLFTEFAPVVNVNSSSTQTASQEVNASTVYNLRSINYTTFSAITNATTFIYTGCMFGEYINYTNVRNEGDMTFTLSQGISTASTLNVCGVFDILSNGYYASSIYNGGNISITDTNNIQKLLSINASGILRYNNSIINDDAQNPLSVNFDNSLVGTLNNTINNGKILVTSTNYDKSNVTANNSALNNLNLIGDINASGIATQNSGIISNAFNLGDIILDVYAMQENTYNAGGITAYQNGEYAQIRDSANNGLIQLINMSLNAAVLNAGGIVARNDLQGNNINQVISFTINYGSVVVFNATPNMELANISINGAHATASGILGIGFCNTVNVVNYGNIYSSETAGGMIGIANLQTFDAVTANLANTLNYGNIYAIRKYYSDASQGGNLVYLTYNHIITLGSNYVFAGDQTIQNQYIGAIVSLIQYSNTSNVNIRYLINFYRSTAIVARELNNPANAIDTSTFITARGSADTFGGGSIKYAPLSTLEDELGNIGVFSNEFVFYKAIDGIGLDDKYVTDSYIGDYFQFVRFDKVNEHLLDTIGWRSIAYSDAAENFVKNILALSALINNAGIEYGDETLDAAFSSNTWISSCDTDIIRSLIENSIKSGKLDDDIQDILNYLLFESSDILTANIRKEMVENILIFYKQQDEYLNYYELLQTLLYDELLAKIVAKNNTNYSEVMDIIRDVMSSSENLDEIFDNYIEVLKDDATILSPLFDQNNNQYYQNVKIELIEKLLLGFNEESLRNIYEKLDKEGEDANLKYTIFLNNNPQYATNIYANLIIYNSLESDSNYLSIINENLARYNYDSIIGTYNSDNNTFTSGETLGTSINNFANLNGVNLVPTLGVTPTKNYTPLWNMIKNDLDVQKFIVNNYFQSIKDPTSSIYYSSLLAKATEYNNTYQTQDAPAVITTNGSVKVGVYRTESLTGNIVNRFIYTPDSVNNVSTYYYGPYDENGTIWNSANMSSKNPPYNQGYDVYANQAVSTTQKTYFPFFVSTNASITENMIAKSNTTSSFGYKPFVWNDVGKSGGTSDKASAGQWVSDYILQKRADDVTALLYKNYNSGEYIVDYYDFSPNKVYHQTGNNSTTVISETATTNYSPINGKNITLSENNSYNHSYTATGNPNEADFLKGYVTSDIISGIWCMFDLWYSDGAIGAYITSKNNGDNADGGYGGIHTTQYTYYQIKDLVALDGIRTKGKNTGTTDSDEINIISALVTKMLSDNIGKKIILKAIANHSSENRITVNDSASVNLLLSSLRGTSITSDMVINNIDAIKDFNYNENQTISQYLDSLNITFDSYKDSILISSVNSQENFRTLLLMLLEEIPKYYDFNLEHTMVKDIVYQYLNDKYNIDTSMTIEEIMSLVNKTDAQISQDINSATDADLTNMNDIFVLDVNQFTKDSVTLNNAMVAPEIVTYNGVTYNQAITSNNGAATITFTTGNNYVMHDLLFSGLLILKKNDQEIARSGENTPITEYAQLLDPNSTYTIEFGNDGKVYSAQFTEQIRNTQTVGPYFTMNDGAVLNITIEGKGFFGTGDAKQGTLGFTLTNTNTSVTLNSLVVTYLLSQTEDETSSPTNSFHSAITDLSGGSVSPNVLEADGSTESDIVHTYTNNPSTIQVQVVTTNNTNNFDADVRISNIRLTATYTLTDGTVVTHTQTGFDTTTNPDAVSTLTNSNGLSVMANSHSFRTGTTGTYPVNNETTQAPVTFIPFTSGTLSHLTSNDVDAASDNFTENYDNISNIGKFLIDDIIFKYNSYSNVSIGNSSYVIVKARSGSSGTISFTLGGNTYTKNINSTTDKYFSVYLPNAGTYTISTTNASISEMYSCQIASSINASNTTNTIVKNYADGSSNTIAFDYSELTTFDISSIITSNVDSLTKYEAFLRGYYFIRDNYVTNREDDILNVITTLFPTIHQDPNNSNYYSIFLEFSDEELIEIIKLIAISDYEGTNSVLYKLVNGLDSKYYEDLLLSFNNDVVEKMIAEEIYDLAVSDKTKYSTIVTYFMSAYLGNDYLDKLNELTNTIMYDILSTYQGGRYLYITGNQTVDADIFAQLVQHLSEGSNINLEGYGIYALSSSKGILNGEFIPDNIVLDDLDIKYETNTNGYYVLSDDTSSNWRGGNDNNENDTTNTDSVNYAVLVEMKQLKKSIGNTIFELNLIDNGGITHYSSESAIDLESGIITYYVPTNYFNSVSTTLTIEEDTISVSNLASICMSGTTTDLRKDGNTNTITLSNFQAENVIRVYAEDTTVFKDYTIQFVEMEVAFDLVYSSVTNGIMDSTTQATVNYKDGVVVLSLTSDTLPEKLDLTPYIDIYSGTNLMDRITSFKLSNEETDHIINVDHDAVITMDILSSLPHGTYTIVINIFGVSDSVVLIKNPSTECSILEFEYEGIDISNSLITNGTHTSYIDFGRAFNYIELSNYTDESFYLNRFSISENATCAITVTKEEDSDGLLTYEIKYLITAENGNQATYTHILEEKHPFKHYGSNGSLSTAFNYASYYKEGNLVESRIYSEDNDITVEFDRGSEPQYRIKYTLSNFYTLGADVEFSINADNAVGATFVDSYAGITATVTNDCNAGTYIFVYNYHNVGTWSDGEYERNWTFPEFIIIKNYSKDATLNNVTYIDGMSMLSSQSTVINATQVFRPIDSDSEAEIENDEIGYFEFSEIDDAQKPIEAEGPQINYQNIENGIDYSTDQYDDYYLIGSLSNAKLAFYAPIFKIEEHAEIYQYTTAYMLANYGEGLQGNITDKEILTTRDKVFIYVPYTKDGETVEIFLVEVTNQNKWTNVYTVDNTTTSIATLTENKGSFSYNNNNYTIHSSAGKPTDNTSLYMDYIGTPLQDHFWYVSYVVFSEQALHTTDNTYVKYFHLSLIDLTNNLYFEIKVNAPVDFALDSIYVTFAAEGVMDGNTPVTKQLSAYVIKPKETDADGNVTYNGETIKDANGNITYYVYILDYDIQILPTGYYYFYFDIPNGYKIEYEITNGKDNQNKSEDYEGAYYPPSSIVTQRIEITFTISEDELNPPTWGVATGDIYSTMASEKSNASTDDTQE